MAVRKEDLAYAFLDVFLNRVLEAKTVISQALAKMRKPYVACSWGKDSTVLLHLLLQFKPNITVVFINQGHNCPMIKKYGVACGEWPDTYRIRDQLVKQWNLNLIELRPPCVCRLQRKHGVPYVGYGDWQEIDRKIYQELIWDPIKELIKREHFDGCFLALREWESKTRHMMLRHHGPLFFAKRWGLLECNPLANWTGQDIWAYIAKHKLPYNTIYDKELGEWTRENIRNSPWMTTYQNIHKGELTWLKKFYPGYWNMFRQEFPAVKTYA